MSRRVRTVWLGTVPYREAWALQRRLAQARRRGEVEDDCVLLLEHPPVYTVGRTGSPEHLGGGPDALRLLGADCIDVDRGGSVTFHGPGQLVAYPVMDVASAFPLVSAAGCGDVIRYVRALESAIIRTVAHWGVDAVTRPPYTGVWTGAPPRHKLAAVGVKVAGGVSTHGIALNVATDLAWFDHITPCGIVGAGVTSLQREGVAAVTVKECGRVLADEIAAALGRDSLGPGVQLASVITECGGGALLAA